MPIIVGLYKKNVNNRLLNDNNQNIIVNEQLTFHVVKTCRRGTLHPNGKVGQSRGICTKPTLIAWHSEPVQMRCLILIWSDE